MYLRFFIKTILLSCYLFVGTLLYVPFCFALQSELINQVKTEQKQTITIALPDTLVNPYDAFTLNELVEALKKKLRRYNVQSVTFSAAEAETQLEKIRPEFILVPSVFSSFAKIESVRIATRRMNSAKDASQSVGAAIVVKKKGNIKKLKDLKGKKVMTALPNAIDGWLAAQREFTRQGLDPEHDFKEILYKNNAYPDVISALLISKVDAAIIPTCLLETIDKEHLADVSELDILNYEKSHENTILACKYSTELYPDISLQATRYAPEEMVRDMTIAILSVENASGTDWLTNVSHVKIDELMKELQIGPYEYLKDMRLSAIYERHKTETWSAFVLLIFLLLNEVRLVRLVRKRTQDLRKSIKEKEKLCEQAEAARSQMIMSERRSIALQMSGMIAHEVNAPVGTIRTWVAIARMKFLSEVSQTHIGSDKQTLVTALNRIDSEAERISAIVSKVRKYARRENEEAQKCSIVEIIDKAIKAFYAEKKDSVRVSFINELSNSANSQVISQPLELEVLFLNLIRNAAAAISNEHDNNALVEIHLYDAVNPSHLVVSVENPGSRAQPGVIQRLNSIGISALPEEHVESKSEGIGLGLTICRGIAEAHGASLNFEARKKGGIKAIFEIDKAN